MRKLRVLDMCFFRSMASSKSSYCYLFWSAISLALCSHSDSAVLLSLVDLEVAVLILPGAI